MKPTLSFLFLFFCLSSYAQKDSLRKFKLSAIQLEHALIGERRMPTLNVSSVKNLVPAATMLKRDLSGFNSYTGAYYFNTGIYNNYLAIKIYADLKTKRKNKPELFLGLRIGNELFSTVSFNKKTNSVEYYTNTNQSEMLVKRSYKDTTYYFSISGKKLFIPLGLNFTSNKTNRFWVSAGIELAPHISFGHTFQELILTSTYSIVAPISVPENELYMYRSGYGSNSFKENTYRINGMGYGFYAAVPLTLNVRLSKRIKVLKKMSASASLVPAYSYTYYKYSGANDSFNTFTFLGVRYSL
jgi:hypothetical protein